MKIKKIHLAKYKRFEDLTIDFGWVSKRIVALVGPNGCGKSSIFDAMLFLQNSYSSIGSTGARDYTYHSLEHTPGYNYTNVKIEFMEGDFSDIYQKKSNIGENKTIFSFRSSFRYNGILNVRESTALNEIRNNDIGASSASDIDQRIDQNYRRLNVKYNKYLNDSDCRPSEAKEHIVSELNAAISNCLELSIDNLGNIEAGQGTLFFKKEDTTSIFEYNVLSAGEKEVVDLLLDLYLRKDYYTDSIYIIDEPELHINTAIQRKLVVEIDKMIPENCQIWIATHSIGFMRAIQDELNEKSQIIEFEEGNEWASKTFTLSPMKKCRNNWIRLFSTALDDLTGLVSPKRIFYCEGRAEPSKNGKEQGLDGDVYNTIFGEKYPDTFFVSSGGHTELDQRSSIAIKILTKVFSDVEIFVLKDRDMLSGRDATEEDRQQYLQDKPKNHRVLKRFEIENYLYDYEVLKEYCNGNNTNFNEAEYLSLVTDIVNQHIKECTSKIKDICGIKRNLNSEDFKKKLAEYIAPTMKVYIELEEVIFKRI